MPTSREEAARICEIIDDFLTEEEAKAITVRLDE